MKIEEYGPADRGTTSQASVMSEAGMVPERVFQTQGYVPYHNPGVSLSLNPRLFIRSPRLASRPYGRHRRLMSRDRTSKAQVIAEA